MSKVFTCNCCNYTTKKSSNYSRHLLSIKHLNNKDIKPDKDVMNNKILNSNKRDFICSCGKTYKHRGSLYNHIKSEGSDHNDISKNSKNLEESKNENEFTLEYQLKLEKEKSKLLNNIIILQEVIHKLSLIE
jgi:hypothetical protein